MAGDVPTADDAVPSFLHALTWACLFACVDAFVADKWIVSAVAGVVALFSHTIGIKWPRVKSRTHFDWSLWDKWIAGATRVAQVAMVLILISVAFTSYYAIRKMFRSDETQTLSKSQGSTPATSNPSSTQSQPASTPSTRRKEPSKSTKQNALTRDAPAAPMQRVDWHDKQNWRRHLHTGMTRTQVRGLFGEPEKMGVVSSSEFWEYGLGQITFDMEGHPDGSLYSWSEPDQR